MDPTGEAWVHWLAGAAIVVGLGLLTVATCGMSVAAAATAVCMFGSGVAATTTVSTIAAAAFVGSAVAYGVAVVDAVANSSSVQELQIKETGAR